MIRGENLILLKKQPKVVVARKEFLLIHTLQAAWENRTAS
jgi:hypothetical protein